MVESDKNAMEGAVHSNGFYFHIDNRLEEIQSQMGKIVIDFINNPWGDNFSIQFEGTTPC